MRSQKPVFWEKTIAGLIVSSFAGFLHAAPTVNGSIISWPADGWYQVQNASDYSSICEGSTSCAVAPGTYIVINHSTGRRYENVVVSETGAEVTPISPSVTVSGNIISWPADGWYQVQDARSYVTICEGVNSCVVELGIYNVINHSTGRRFEDIVVGAVDHPPEEGTSSVMLNGNTFTLPDDGWYQVQDARNYSSICQGVRSCTVENGQYFVINHSSGDRFEFTVSGEQGDDASFINEGNWEAIFAEVVDIINATELEQLESEAGDFGNLLWGVSTVGSSVPGFDITLASRAVGSDGNQQAFSCDAGGSISALQVFGEAITPLDFSANSCSTTSGVINGSYELGALTREGSSQSTFIQYSMLNSAGMGVLADGERSTTADRVDFEKTVQWSDVDIDITATGGSISVIGFDKTSQKFTGQNAGGTGVFNITQSDGTLVEATIVRSSAMLISGFDVIYPAPLDRTLTVRASLSHDGDFVQGGGEFNSTGLTVDAFSVTTGESQPLTMTAPANQSEANWDSGTVSIEARDGSSVTIFADSGDSDTYQIQLNGGTDLFTRSWSETTTIYCEGAFGGCAR